VGSLDSMVRASGTPTDLDGGLRQPNSDGCPQLAAISMTGRGNRILMAVPNSPPNMAVPNSPPNQFAAILKARAALGLQNL
jgi:hypothetical protein